MPRIMPRIMPEHLEIAFESFLRLGVTYADGMNSLAGFAGCAVIFGATVFGIYTDYPPTRTKLLGVIYTAAFFIGLASRW